MLLAMVYVSCDFPQGQFWVGSGWSGLGAGVEGDAEAGGGT